MTFVISGAAHRHYGSPGTPQPCVSGAAHRHYGSPGAPPKCISGASHRHYGSPGAPMNCISGAEHHNICSTAQTQFVFQVQRTGIFELELNQSV